MATSIQHDTPLLKHIPALDALRGIAILLVVVHHLERSIELEFFPGSPLFRLFNWGWIGVDLFFVLSGFLITGILWDSREDGRYFRNFYAKRALRIFPIYVATLLVALLLRLLATGSPLVGGKEIAGHAWLWLYQTNFVLAVKGWGAFGFLDHFWSLAIEEHFYFIWPFLVLRLSRTALLKTIAGIIGGAFLLRCLIVLTGISSNAAYILTPCRADSLAIGGALALAMRGAVPRPMLLRACRVTASAAGLFLTAIILHHGRFSHEDPLVQTLGYSLLAAICGAALVYSVTAAPGSVPRWILDHRSLRTFGKYSYGLYIYHPPIFVTLYHTPAGRFLRYPEAPLLSLTLTTAAALGVTALVTYLSWNCCERHCLKLKRYFEPPRASSELTIGKVQHSIELSTHSRSAG